MVVKKGENAYLTRWWYLGITRTLMHLRKRRFRPCLWLALCCVAHVERKLGATYPMVEESHAPRIPLSVLSVLEVTCEPTLYRSRFYEPIRCNACYMVFSKDALVPFADITQRRVSAVQATLFSIRGRRHLGQVTRAVSPFSAR